MAQRYITAMDFADMHARKILRKQAMVRLIGIYIVDCVMIIVSWMTTALESKRSCFDVRLLIF